MTARLSSVPVDDGDLVVAEWGDPSAPAVLALHGVTSSHLAFRALARDLPGVRVVAPDLRGRGGSAGLPGPYGLRRHADDVARVVDALGLGPLPVVGHSMGAFVAVALADARPDAVSALVLVDGGFPLDLPAGTEPTPAVIETLLGPSADRLRMTFPTGEAYREFWRVHPAFVGAWSDDVQRYVDYDLVGEPPELHPATSTAALLGDQPDLYGPDWYLDALRRLRMPVTVLRAPRDLVDVEGGLYAPGRLDGFTELVPQLRVVEVPDVNHYTIVMTEPGAAQVADAVRAALGRPGAV